MGSNANTLLERYMSPLLAGNRIACRDLILKEASAKLDAVEIYHEILWPAMERVEDFYHSDRINAVTEHMATRINRSVADQVQASLKQSQLNGRRIVICCANDEPEELGAQMCSDLFEARGWEVYFLGGGLPNDEVMTLCGQLRPDVLLVFGTQPSGVPEVRKLIDMIREIGVNPTMNIMVSGGIYNRADGLWKEIDADLVSSTATEAIKIAESAPPRKPTLKIPGAPKKRRRRRKPVTVNGENPEAETVKS